MVISIKEFDLYNDIQMRTKGEIYLGVIGPVRTGKSTFIKRFMDLLVMKETGQKTNFHRVHQELQ